jgi:hypothetical protein
VVNPAARAAPATDGASERELDAGDQQLLSYREEGAGRGGTAEYAAPQVVPSRTGAEPGVAVAAVVDRAREAGVTQPDIEATDLFALIYMVDSPAEFARPLDSDIRWRCMTIAPNSIGPRVRHRSR